VRWERRHGAFESNKAGRVFRQAKAQQVAIPIELPNPDLMPGKMPVQGRRLQMESQSVKHGAADDPEASADQNAVQRVSLVPEERAHGIRPIPILKSSVADYESTACTGICQPIA
jgi:hypothetical protein